MNIWRTYSSKIKMHPLPLFGLELSTTVVLGSAASKYHVKNSQRSFYEKLCVYVNKWIIDPTTL